MNKIIPIANFTLVLLAAFFLVRSVQTWTHSKYPAKVDGTQVTGSAKSIQPLAIDRKPYNSRMTREVVTKNLFRKERTEFKQAVQVASATDVKKPAVPPPDLKLKGVILLGGTKIALLEGTYPVVEMNNSVKNKPIKRKGYFLGSQIGDYHLTHIEKTSVTLDGSRGETLQLKLADRPPDKLIQRQGNALIQTNKSFNPKDLKEAPPTRRPPPPATAPSKTKTNPADNPPAKNNNTQKRNFRVSGASTNQHISGR